MRKDSLKKEMKQDLQSELRSAGYTGNFELSELIEACRNIIGDDLICIGTISKDNNDYAKYGAWHSAVYKGMFQLPYAAVISKTVEESVANLWLKLK